MKRTVLLLLLAGCVDTTGSALVTFRAAAAGPADATGGALESDTGLGYHVTLTRATLHMGAVYLRRSNPSAGAQATPCILPGPSYSGQVRVGRDVDLLSPDPQPFPDGGDGTADASPVAEVWLVGGPVEATSDATVIAELAGTASKDGVSHPFSARITISTGNRGLAGSDPSQPGAHPICKQRIVTPITAGFTPGQGGTLLVRADPRKWLGNLEFAEVPADPGQPGAVAFPDSNGDQQSLDLFNTLRAASTYSVTFVPAPAP